MYLSHQNCGRGLKWIEVTTKLPNQSLHQGRCAVPRFIAYSASQAEGEHKECLTGSGKFPKIPNAFASPKHFHGIPLSWDES